jgi:hypothetical protein
MLNAISSEKGGDLDEEEATKFMDRLVHLEDRFHSECF